MTSHRIISSSCYFDRHLAEINENPQLLNTEEEKNLATFLSLTDKWSPNNVGRLENWHHFYEDRIFHACHT